MTIPFVERMFPRVIAAAVVALAITLHTFAQEPLPSRNEWRLGALGGLSRLYHTSALPIIPTATPGPAYVLVDHSGVFQITENGATTVFPVPKESSSHFTEIALSPKGNLWLSDFQGIRIRTQGGDVSSLRSVKDGPLYKKLILRYNLT